MVGGADRATAGGTGSGAAAGAGAVEVVRVADRHIPQLANFIRQVWDPNANPDTVRRAREASAAENPAAGGTPPATFLLLSGDRAIGHVGTIPIRLWYGCRAWPAHWVKGLMVLPEHRNGPVGFMVLKEATKHLDCALAMVVEVAPRRLFGALGFTDLGPLPNYLRVLRPARILQRLDLERIKLGATSRRLAPLVGFLRRSDLAALAGYALGAGIGLVTATVGRSRRALRAEYPPRLDRDEVSRLWDAVRSALPACPVRDGAYLGWRYDAGPSAPYRLALVREGEALVGLSIVRRPSAEPDPRLGDARVAVISDLLFHPERQDVGLAALAAAETLARDLEADALLCSASHAAVSGALRRRAYFPLPGNVHVLVRRLPEGAGAPTLAEWWLTRGDSNADDVF
jgi:hypothetical protein